jgi:hypothetical protein
MDAFIELCGLPLDTDEHYDEIVSSVIQLVANGHSFASTVQHLPGSFSIIEDEVMIAVIRQRCQASYAHTDNEDIQELLQEMMALKTTVPYIEEHEYEKQLHEIHMQCLDLEMRIAEIIV